MSKAKELETAIAGVAKPGDCLPEELPNWIKALGIIPGDLITNSAKIGHQSSNNKTDILIKFKNSNPVKISAKLSNADYFGNWYGHKRFLDEFGDTVFQRMTTKVTGWANNKWSNHQNAKIFVGVSISFGSRTGDTFIPFLDIFDNTNELIKIIAGVGDGDNVANCLYVSDDHPKSIGDLLEKLSPISSQSVVEQSKDIKIICRPVNPMTEGSNRGKNVYTRFEPYQPLANITTITDLSQLMKLGKFIPVEPNGLNHNHILDGLEQKYNIIIPRKPKIK